MKLLLLIYFIQNYLSPITSMQCRDENNKAVDWFVLYKLPEIKHQQKFIKAGVAYTFMTSDDYSSWRFSNNSINSTNSMIANTLQGLYNKGNDTMYILYNDEPPNRKSISSKGHNKGVIMANSTGGFWLIHSVPHFPASEQFYIFPRTGAVYGQSFLCISMNISNLNNVGIQLQYNEPQIYSEDVSENFKTLLPDLAKAAANTTIANPPWYNVMNLFSKDGLEFTSFAKTKHFNKDLYEDLVAPSLESNLFVETWPNGPGRLHSNCTRKFKVNNIKSIYLISANVSFTTTEDHSKWAVSSPSQAKNWLCIGDINRAEHQKVRGGGTVCVNNEQMADDYKGSVKTVEKCSKFTTLIT